MGVSLFWEVKEINVLEAYVFNLGIGGNSTYRVKNKKTVYNDTSKRLFN